MLPVSTELGNTLVGAPVPNLLGDPKTDGEGTLESEATDLLVRTPGAVVGAPLTMPNGDNFGIPDLTMPKLGLTTPELIGTPTALLGLR